MEWASATDGRIRNLGNFGGLSRMSVRANKDYERRLLNDCEVQSCQVVYRSPHGVLLALLLMRRAKVGKLPENVGVRFQTAGRAFAFG